MAGLRQKIEEKIRKKEEEREILLRSAAQCDAAIEAFRETLKMIPRDDSALADPLRNGSLLWKAREALRKSGHELQVNDLLHAIGRPVNKNTRVSLSGSISTYVRRREVFSRPAPNTFGLLEWSRTQEPPSDFGISEETEEE